MRVLLFCRPVRVLHNAHVEPRRFRRPRARRRRLRRRRDDAPDRRRLGGWPRSPSCRAGGSRPFSPSSATCSPIETVLFGLADLVALIGYWPKAYEAILAPTLSAARDGAVRSRHFRRFAFSPRAQDDDDRRSVLRRSDADLDPPFAASADHAAPGPLCPHQRLLPHPHQSVPGRARRCASISSSGSSATPFRSPTKPTGSRSGTSSWSSSFRWRRSPSSSGIVEFFVASNFVLQWRRWMTASFTSRWLMHSMHYKLALCANAADDPHQEASEEFAGQRVPTDNPDQRISQDIGGFISGAGTGINSGNAGIYNYTIQAISTATNLVAFSIILWGISRNSINAPIFGIANPGLSVLGRGPLRLLRHRHDASDRPLAVAGFISASRRSRRTSASISRASANSASRSPCSRASSARSTGPTGCSATSSQRSSASSACALGSSPSLNSIPRSPRSFPTWSSRLSILLKKVDFGRFNQSADAFGNVNSAMNFFVDQYIGLADFRATIERLTSFEDAFARARADEKQDSASDVGAVAGPDPVAERRRSRVARRPQTGSYRRPGAGPPGVDAVRRTLGRRQVDAFSRHRGLVAVRLGRDPSAGLRQAHAPAAAALYPDRAVA